MIVFAIGSTIFNIVGPKILGKATTEIFKGLVRKVSGGVDRFWQDRTYCTDSVMPVSDKCSVFIRTGVYHDRSITEADLSSEKRNLRKINRLPMNYFDKQTHGEVLSRITNDIDTLSQSLNQSATQVITSVTTIIGVLIMMLSISPLMTLVALLILPVSMGLISMIVKRSQKYFMSDRSIWAM